MYNLIKLSLKLENLKACSVTSSLDFELPTVKDEKENLKSKTLQRPSRLIGTF